MYRTWDLSDRLKVYSSETIFIWEAKALISQQHHASVSVTESQS